MLKFLMAKREVPQVSSRVVADTCTAAESEPTMILGGRPQKIVDVYSASWPLCVYSVNGTVAGRRRTTIVDNDKWEYWREVR